MAKQAASVPKPTLVELRGMGEIPDRIVDRIEEIAIRLIQIQEEQKRLDEEEGYTKGDGTRVPGLRDEMQELMQAWEFTGVRLEDFTVYRMSGTAKWLDKTALINAGVMPGQIVAGTLEQDWTAVGIRKTAAREGEEYRSKRRGKGGR